MGAEILARLRELALSFGCAFLTFVAVYVAYIALLWLALDQGVRFVRTWRWLRRHGGRIQPVIDAYVEYELTSPNVHIWLPRDLARPDFPEVEAAWRERQRKHYREHPTFVPDEVYREHGLPPPPAASIYTRWREWSFGVSLGLLLTVGCVAAIPVLWRCTQ